jgi:hypothetical protein
LQVQLAPAVQEAKFESRQPVVFPQQGVPPAVHVAPWSRQTSQAQVPPAQALPEVVSAQVSPLQQPDCEAQLDPTVAQVWHVPPLQTRPMQQSAEVPQLWVAALHESHTHPAPPAQSVPSPAMQESVGLWLQHCVVSVQPWSCDWHVAGTAHFPAMQLSVELAWAGSNAQQSVFSAQLAPVGAQVVAATQVPAVWPGGTEQVSPPQQSPFVVQVPFAFTHGAAQTASLQLFEQQSLATVHVPPLALQLAGTSQVNAVPPQVQTVPEQQLPSSDPVQEPWSAVQDGTVQRSTPWASGTQGAKLQHWSRNWQTPPGAVAVPAAMQHCGFVAS